MGNRLQTWRKHLPNAYRARAARTVENSRSENGSQSTFDWRTGLVGNQGLKATRYHLEQIGTNMATTDLDEQRWHDHETILRIISDFQELTPTEASALQIFGALLKECKLGYQQGFIKEVLPDLF